MAASNHLLQRLSRDLWDLHTSPDDWFRVHPSEENIRNLCLTLFPISGPFQGLSLHFNAELPLNWVGPRLFYLRYTSDSCHPPHPFSQRHHPEYGVLWKALSTLIF